MGATTVRSRDEDSGPTPDRQREVIDREAVFIQLIGGCMIRIRFPFILIFLCGCAVRPSVFGQDTLNVTLERSVAIALEKNPEIRMAEKELSKTHAGVWEAVANLGPKVNASVNYQHVWELQKTKIPNFLKDVLGGPDYLEFAFGLENTLTYGANLTMPVFLGGAGWAGVRIANAAKHTAEAALETSRQGLIYNTVNAFYACLLAKEVFDVQEQAMEQSKGNLDLVRKKFDSGTASGFDRMRAEVDLANLQPQLISSRNGYQSAVTGLRMLMGLAENAPIRIDGRLEYADDGLDSLSLSGAEAMSRRFRPEFDALRARQSMASGGVAIARSQFLPKLFFQTDYSFLNMWNKHEYNENMASKGFTSAVSLQIPLFGGFNNWQGYRKARLDFKISKDAEKQMDDGIAAEVEMAYNEYREGREKYLSAKESIAMAEEAMRLANLMYEEGASTQLDVMGARLALTQARLNYASSLYEYQMARYGLRKAAGILKGVL
jgi:outer membrane protein